MANKRIRKKWSAEWGKCPLCGRPLPADESQRVAGSTGREVCANCIETGQKLLSLLQPKPKATETAAETQTIQLPSPSEVLTALDRSIIGQDEAKKAVVMALWKQSLRARGEDIPNDSLLLYGPTGCGKTALLREAAKLMDLPFLSFDATSISETGYRGRDAVEMVKDLAHRCGVENAAHGVILIDEVDKIAARKGNEHRAAYCRGTQYSLLKLIEGMDIELEDDTIDTSGILFLFGGAFSDLTRKKTTAQRRVPIGFERERTSSEEEPLTELEPEDFVSFGLEAELMGRIGRCVRLEALTGEQLRKILLESELSVFQHYQAFFRRKGRKLAMDETDINTLVKKALERGMGARGLNALVEEWIQPKLAELAEGYYGQAG